MFDAAINGLLRAEHVVIGHEFHLEPFRSCSDPPIRLVHLLTECQTGPLARHSEFGAQAHQLVVGLNDDDPGKITFNAPRPKLTPSGLQRAVAGLGHRTRRVPGHALR